MSLSTRRPAISRLSSTVPKARQDSKVSSTERHELDAGGNAGIVRPAFPHMIKKIAVGLVAYGVALVATMPATVVDAVIDASTRGVARIKEARGTAWSGGGLLEIRDGSSRIAVQK